MSIDSVKLPEGLGLPVMTYSVQDAMSCAGMIKVWGLGSGDRETLLCRENTAER